MCRFVLFVFAVVVTTGAAAMRCGEHVVNEGFSPLEVLERCGEPVLRQEWVEHYYPYGPARFVDEWTYEPGRTRFRRLLHFENGRLIRITKQKKPVHSFRAR